jgi:carbohydrate kinase (thermoresistant glucokinase family)
MKPVVVVMGVCGAGKSTIGEALARRLGAKFVDSDSLHPQTNVNKMAAGTPLTDEDRWPWLGLVGAELAAHHPDGIIVACSALKAKAPTTIFVQLDVEVSLLVNRLNQRPGHFMPPSLLESQLETLQPLEADEAGITVSTSEGIDSTVDQIVPHLEDVHEVSQYR